MKKVISISILLILILFTNLPCAFSQNNTSIPSIQEKEITITVSKNTITITTSSSEEMILYNTLGKEVFRGNTKIGDNTIRVNSPGIYLIKIGQIAKKIAIKSDN